MTEVRPRANAHRSRRIAHLDRMRAERDTLYNVIWRDDATTAVS